MSSSISIVICCHNSAQRLTETLAHLASQKVDTAVNWEVIVVDNASTDTTAEVALASWPCDASAPLRVVHEPQPGLSHARLRGFSEARYDLICFVDDDNWLAPDYIQIAVEIMSHHPQIAVLGGAVEAVCEIDPPSWFETFKSGYAVGRQAEATGAITWTRGYVWGAGMVVRREAWLHLHQKGFRSLLTDRTSGSLSSGGDSELCYAFRLAGWAIWYDGRLQMRHYLPAGRLTWSYLRKLQRGFGAASVILAAYQPANLVASRSRVRNWLRTHWLVQAMLVLREMARLLPFLPHYFSRSFEGSPEVARVEALLGKLLGLLRRRSGYKEAICRICYADWVAKTSGGETKCGSLI